MIMNTQNNTSDKMLGAIQLPTKKKHSGPSYNHTGFRAVADNHVIKIYFFNTCNFWFVYCGIIQRML